jgi:phosphonate transport system permease protein
MQSTSTVSPALRDPALYKRLSYGLAALVLLGPSLYAVEFKPWILLAPDNVKITARFVGEFFPPNLSVEFLAMVGRETWRTVAIATAGIALALLVAVPLALASTAVLSVSSLPGRMHALPFAVRQAVRVLLILLRSIPELVWALVFVRVVGLGATAGVLAIALTYSGMLGKVYGDILESSDVHASTALLRNGAGRLQAFLYGLLPQNAGELTSYTVYRWECAIRSSTVLGFVGAGGLGQQMEMSMKMFNGSEVSTMLIAFVLLVWLADHLSLQLRKVIA